MTTTMPTTMHTPTPTPMSNLFYALSLQRACKLSKCPLLSFFYMLNITGTWEDDAVMLAGPSHTRVRAHWIPAGPCACPLDPRTPMCVPTGSSHAQSIPDGSPCMHACTHAPGPCTHARTGSPLARRVPTHTRLLARRVPMPRSLAGSPCPHAASPRSRMLHLMHVYTRPLDASSVHPSTVSIGRGGIYIVAVVQREYCFCNLG